MSEFRPYALFADVLSGEFRPLSDPQRRSHTLARLATGACLKGRGPNDCRDYIPSWADNSYIMVEQQPVGNIDTRITIAERAGRWPSVVTLTDFALNAAMGPREHELVIEDNRDLIEVVSPLELSPQLDLIRQDIADIAQVFYDSVEN